MHPVRLALALCCALSVPALGQPLTNTFTYQGELVENNAAASGAYDLQFALYDSVGGATQVGPTLCADNVAVVNGRFTVSLDFGAQFNNQTRHLEVRVRRDTGLACGNTTGFATLTPRTTLTVAPSAAFALSASNATQLNGQPPSFYNSAANLTGTAPSTLLSGSYTNPVTFSNVGNTFAGNGGNLVALNAANLSTGTLANARTTGTALNTVNTLVLRDASGSFSAGNISASFFGDGSGLTFLNAGNVSSGVLAPTRGGTGLSSSPSTAGQFLRSTSAGAWGISTLLSSDLPALGGDLSGTLANATVASIRNRPVSATIPAANQVLTFNGSQWAPATPAAPPTYTAGAGLSLAGTTFSVPASAISSAMLATDGLSLNKVSGGMMAVSGPNIGINIGAPLTDLHIRSAAPIVRVAGDANGAAGATIELLEDLGVTGARLSYNGSANDFLIGTVASGVTTTAMTIPRGTPDVLFSGDLVIPTTTRTLSISAGAFNPNPFAEMSINTSTGAPKIVFGGAATSTGRAYAHVQIPEGAVVTGFEAFINGGSPANPISASLRRVTMAAAATGTAALATVTSTGGTGPFTTASIGNSTIDNDGFSYIVHVSWTNTGAHFFDFYGCRITYTLNSAIP